MSQIYHPTPLEDWVTLLYKRMGIYVPEDLNEKVIARTFDIFIKHKDISSVSYQNGRFKSIILNSSLSFEQQREDFYHELCHILRHAGQQYMMPKAFRELQERDARHFTRYAAIPFHMLSSIDFTDSDVISLMSSSFRVTEELCVERLEKIKSRILTRERIC